MYKNFPNCVDFIAMYGCESDLDDNFVQVTVFNRDQYQLVFATDSRDFIEIKFLLNGNKIADIHEEGVERIELLDQKIKVYFKNELGFFDNKTLEVNIYPDYSIELVTMLS